MHTVRPQYRRRPHTPHSASAAVVLLPAFALAAAALTGCGLGPAGSSVRITPTPSPALKLTGKVYGGQQPVSGATLQLYTVGTTGLKSASTGLIASPPQTDANGNFSITGLYNNCNGSTPGTLVYLVATGGVAVPAETNNNLVLMAALGPCSALTANTIILVNEVTTVAAAYALAPFAANYAHIGGSGTYPAGLTQAFQNAALLANTSAGSAPGANLATGVTVPVAEINTLGNILATCINTGGVGASDGGNCTTLFSATNAASYSAVSATPDTFGAALGIVATPGATAVTALTALPTYPGAPFLPVLPGAPADYTVAVTFAGPAGSLATPSGLAMDPSGNAWVANAGGTTITELSPTGTASSFTATGLFGPQGIAADRSGNIWVANTAGNSVLEFTAASSYATATPFTSASLAGPAAIALDSQGNAFVASVNSSSVVTITGSTVGSFGSSYISVPTGIALDAADNIYVTSGNGSVVESSHAGAYVASLTDNTLQGPVSLALDPAGHLLATGFTTGTGVGGAISQFAAGSAATVSPVATAFTNPAGIATDGTSIWVANSTSSGGLAQFTYGGATSLSPGNGFGTLNTPVAVAVDASGSVWTANSGSNTVSKFIGLAVPVTTPLAANVGP